MWIERRSVKILPVAPAGVALLLYGLLLAPAEDPAAPQRVAVIALGLGGVYLLMLRLARPLSLFGRDRPTLLALAAAALLVRAAAVIGADTTAPAPPDVFRCVWEGKLVAEGYNPYAVPPGSSQGEALADDALYPRMCGHDRASTHPPLAQYLFAAAYLLHSESLHGFGLLSLLAELATLLGVIMLAAPLIEKRPFHSWSILIYAFSPLVMLEFLRSHHVDILAMPFFVFSLVRLRRDDAAGTGLLLALATLVKPGALLFAAVIFMHFVGRKRLFFLAGLVFPGVLLYLPFGPKAGTHIAETIRQFLTQPEFNSSAYRLIAWLSPTEEAARVIAAGLLLAVVGIAAYPLRERVPRVSGRLFIAAAAGVILAPALDAAALVWILPFVVLYRNLPFLVLTALAPPAAHVLAAAGGDSAALAWLPALEHAPFYALLLALLIRSAVRNRQPEEAAVGNGRSG